ncbi:MAG: hypothetical protein AAB459_01935 [Patescibacteria group bacterium]
MKNVEVNAVRFINKKGIKSVPRAVTIDNQYYTFIDAGLQYLVQQGQHLVRLFDLSDGHQQFRLRLEDNEWTLVNVRALSS